MTILVLGPSKKRRRGAGALPKVVEATLPPGWKRRLGYDHLDRRAALVGFLRGLGHEATLMEMNGRKAGEPHTALFERTVREHAVDRFFVYWPAGAQRAGLDIELGNLLLKLERGEDLDVRVFIESRAGTTASGEFESLESGSRTRYYEDLLTYGCPIIEWEEWRALLTAFRIHASSPR